MGYRPDSFAELCRACDGRSGFTIRQIAKMVRMSPKTIRKIVDLAPIRPSTGLKLIERLR